jgi:hypothetical protein
MTYLELAVTDYRPRVAITLLPTESVTTVSVNHETVWCGALDQMVTVVQEFDIDSPLMITIAAEAVEGQHPVAQIAVDGQDHTPWILSQSTCKDKLWVFDSGCAYYQWLHSTTGQGWLLTPRSRPQDNEDTARRDAV